jgi:hypothetical protein
MDSSKSDAKQNQRSPLLPGIVILSAALLAFAIHSLWHRMHYPRRLQQLARDFASIHAYREPPVVNHAGTKIGLICNTPKGLGVFIADTSARKRETLCEADDDADVGTPHAFGWSPNDRTFAYRWNVELRFTTGDGKPEPGAIDAPYFVAFAWLSPNRCAYIDGNTNQNNIPQLAVAEKAGDQWRQIAVWPLPASQEKPRSLLASGTNTVVWLTAHTVWQMDLAAGTVKTLYSNPKSGITSLAYSPDTGKFLLIETAHRARTSSLSILENGSKIPQPTDKFLMRDAQWINHGKGYACLKDEGDDSSVVVHSLPELPVQTFFRHAQIGNFICPGEGSRLFVFASLTNEAPSLWQCDADSGETRQLLSPWGFTNAPVHFQPALTGYAPFPPRHYEKFVLIPPAHFSRGKKYPLVIGMQGYDWMNVAHATYSQALANCGAYVALTGYHYIPHQSVQSLLEYSNRVLAVYNQMTKNPNVDTSRIYLFAFSSSTLVVNHLIQDYPGRWRGIMLFSPTAKLPLPDGRNFPPVLATAGSGEEWLWKQFPAYQETLAKEGILSESFIHPQENHIQWSQNTLYRRTLLMGKMIFGN